RSSSVSSQSLNQISAIKSMGPEPSAVEGFSRWDSFRSAFAKSLPYYQTGSVAKLIFRLISGRHKNPNTYKISKLFLSESTRKRQF
uniref:hypothetical protein n=1 Tax=Neokomagataea thailandica TaxID=661190 RepID=UPI002265D6A3